MHTKALLYSMSRFCWGAKGRERFAKGGARAILGYHNFEQPPYIIYPSVFLGHQYNSHQFSPHNLARPRLRGEEREREERGRERERERQLFAKPDVLGERCKTLRLGGGRWGSEAVVALCLAGTSWRKEPKPPSCLTGASQTCFLSLVAI